MKEKIYGREEKCREKERECEEEGKRGEVSILRGKKVNENKDIGEMKGRNEGKNI